MLHKIKSVIRTKIKINKNFSSKISLPIFIILHAINKCIPLYIIHQYILKKLNKPFLFDILYSNKWY